MLFDPRWQKPGATQQVLMEAKVAIEQYGWLQGCFGSMETGFCLMGAVDRVIHDRDKYAVFDVYDAIHMAIGSRNVAWWNDMPGRTKEEVLAKFDEAIKWAGAEKENADVS